MSILSDYTTSATIVLIGAGVGIGKLLVTRTPLTAGLVFGHSLVSAGFALSGLALLAVIPSLVLEAKLGLAAMFSSLGLVGLEKLANRLFTPTPPSQ